MEKEFEERKWKEEIWHGVVELAIARRGWRCESLVLWRRER